MIQSFFKFCLFEFFWLKRFLLRNFQPFLPLGNFSADFLVFSEDYFFRNFSIFSTVSQVKRSSAALL